MGAWGNYRVDSAAEAASEREQLILQHLPQVRLIARRIHDRLPDSVSLDDLISTGIIGLIAAIDNFDPSHNVLLKSYAEHKIRGAILDSLRDLDWAPKEKRKLSKQIESAIAAAEQRFHREPTEEEIAAQLKISLDEYHRWLTEVQGIDIENLQYVSGGNDEVKDLLRFIADDGASLPSEVFEKAQLEKLLAEAIERMPKVERTVLSLYYLEEMNLREIAQIMSIHLSRVSQLKVQAVLRLRRYIEKRWPIQRRGKE
jgi:RNA polymerase sigma factor for flagellar operon FliA